MRPDVVVTLTSANNPFLFFAVASPPLQYQLQNSAAIAVAAARTIRRLQVSEFCSSGLLALGVLQGLIAWLLDEILPVAKPVYPRNSRGFWCRA